MLAMHTTTLLHPAPKPMVRLPRLLLLLGTTGALLISMALSAGMAYAGGIPGGRIGDPVVRAVDIAKPAIVRIITTLGGHITIHITTTNQGTVSATFPQSGGSYPLRLSGSGSFISAHGDLLTADHVVNPPHDASLDAFLYETAAPDIARFVNQRFNLNPPFTANDVIIELETGTFPSTTSYDPATSEVYLSTDYTGPETGTRLRDIPAANHLTVDRIEQQSSFDRKDVAIIHVNMQDTPSIFLGDSSAVEQQDELTILGFPGSGDVTTIPTNLLTSSVNKIFVSSMKTTDSGAPVIQVGGNVEHGDSGGPALDSQGNIVGIVSFGLSIPNTAGATTFLQASNSAKELLQSLNLDIKPGAFQKAWGQAFADYASTSAGHWQLAQQELAKIAASYPAFNAIGPYLTYAQDQAKHEPKSTRTQPGPDYTWVWFVLGGALLVLLGIILLVVVVRRQGRKSVASVSIGTPSAVATPWAPTYAPPFMPAAPGEQMGAWRMGAEAPAIPTFAVAASTPTPVSPLSNRTADFGVWPGMPSAPSMSPPAASTSNGTTPAQTSPQGDGMAPFGAPSAPNGSAPAQDRSLEDRTIPFSAPSVPNGSSPGQASLPGEWMPRFGVVPYEQSEAPPPVRSEFQTPIYGLPSYPPGAGYGSQPPQPMLPPSGGMPWGTSPTPVPEKSSLWPCRHMNLPSALYCNTCGRAAPPPLLY